MIAKTKDNFINYWWKMLFIISIFNIIFMINYKKNKYYSNFQNKIILLTTIYVIIWRI